VEHLTPSTEGLRTCGCKGEGALGRNIFCSNLFSFSDREKKGSLSLVKKAGPAVDLVPELRTSYYLPSRMNFIICVSPQIWAEASYHTSRRM